MIVGNGIIRLQNHIKYFSMLPTADYKKKCLKSSTSVHIYSYLYIKKGQRVLLSTRTLGVVLISIS